MNTFSTNFDQSPHLDGIADETPPDLARRLATYSTEAVRTGIQVEKVIVQHADFKNVLKTVDRLFQLGTEMETPHGARILGGTGTGKLTLLKYFSRSMPRSSLFSYGLGVIPLRIPVRPRTGEFIYKLLNVTKYPFLQGNGRQLYQKRKLVAEALKGIGTRVIWLHQAQNLLNKSKDIPNATAKDYEIDAITFFLELIDECQISLVLTGTAELEGLSGTSKELASRTPTVERLSDFSDDKVWMGFVRAFAKQCAAFDLAFLDDPRVAKYLHMSCDGNLRHFKQLITEAVMIAVDRNSLTLNQKLLSEAFQVVWGSASVRSNPFA